MQDSNVQKLMTALGRIIAGHRKAAHKTMYKISAESSMSKSTWREAELGVCKNITLTTLWKISEGLEIPLSQLMAELKAELGENFSLTEID